MVKLDVTKPNKEIISIVKEALRKAYSELNILLNDYPIELLLKSLGKKEFDEKNTVKFYYSIPYTVSSFITKHLDKETKEQIPCNYKVHCATVSFVTAHKDMEAFYLAKLEDKEYPVRGLKINNILVEDTEGKKYLIKIISSLLTLSKDQYKIITHSFISREDKLVHGLEEFITSKKETQDIGDLYFINQEEQEQMNRLDILTYYRLVEIEFRSTNPCIYGKL